MVLLSPNIGQIGWSNDIQQINNANLNILNSSKKTSLMPAQRMMSHKHRCH